VIVTQRWLGTEGQGPSQPFNSLPQNWTLLRCFSLSRRGTRFGHGEVGVRLGDKAASGTRVCEEGQGTSVDYLVAKGSFGGRVLRNSLERRLQVPSASRERSGSMHPVASEICDGVPWPLPREPSRPSPSSSQKAVLLQVALVTTMHAPPSLPTWLRWHLSLGISPILIFIDTPSPQPTHPAFEAARAFGPAVRCVCRRTEQAGMGLYERQIDNAKAGISLAREEYKVDWMLHLDDDELFFPRAIESTGRLSKDALHSVFPPMESNGEHHTSLGHHPTFPFHPICVHFGNYEALTTVRDGRDMDLFLGPPCPTFASTGVLAYCNGKGAAYLRSKEPLSPAGVHRFRSDSSCQQGEVAALKLAFPHAYL